MLKIRLPEMDTFEAEAELERLVLEVGWSFEEKGFPDSNYAGCYDDGEYSDEYLMVAEVVGWNFAPPPGPLLIASEFYAISPQGNVWRLKDCLDAIPEKLEFGNETQNEALAALYFLHVQCCFEGRTLLDYFLERDSDQWHYRAFIPDAVDISLMDYHQDEYNAAVDAYINQLMEERI